MQCVISSRLSKGKISIWPTSALPTKKALKQLLESLFLVQRFRLSPSLRLGECPTRSHGWGVGVACGTGSRFKLGGAGLLLSGFAVLSGVVVESSGVGCRRFKVGRPGVPSSDPPIVPLDEARAFDNLNRRFFTR